MTYSDSMKKAYKEALDKAKNNRNKTKALNKAKKKGS